MDRPWNHDTYVNKLIPVYLLLCYYNTWKLFMDFDLGYWFDSPRRRVLAIWPSPNMSQRQRTKAEHRVCALLPCLLWGRCHPRNLLHPHDARGEMGIAAGLSILAITRFISFSSSTLTITSCQHLWEICLLQRSLSLLDSSWSI